MERAKMVQNYAVGDRVLYHPVGSSSTVSVGRITQVLTDPELVGQERPVTIHADPTHPRIVIQNEHTGKITAYRPESIIKAVGEHEEFPKGFGVAGVSELTPEESNQIPMEYPQPRKIHSPPSPGKRVVYHPVGSSPVISTGVVTEVFTEPTLMMAGDRGEITVHASQDHPRVVIKNDHTGKEIPYPLESLVSVD